ncbi:hypothetical protein Bca101_082995 [Brassica carinata]
MTSPFRELCLNGTATAGEALFIDGTHHKSFAYLSGKDPNQKTTSLATTRYASPFCVDMLVLVNSLEDLDSRCLFSYALFKSRDLMRRITCFSTSSPPLFLLHDLTHPIMVALETDFSLTKGSEENLRVNAGVVIDLGLFGRDPPFC